MWPLGEGFKANVVNIWRQKRAMYEKLQKLEIGFLKNSKNFWMLKTTEIRLCVLLEKLESLNLFSNSRIYRVWLPQSLMRYAIFTDFLYVPIIIYVRDLISES